MSVDIETRLRTFLASSPQTIWPIQTIELGHSAMTQTYYLWREPYTYTLWTEDGLFPVLPVNMEIRLAGAEGHMDQNFDITIDTVDIEDQLREELDRIPLDTLERIRCVYREYLSDDISPTGIVSRATLQVEAITFVKGVATISASLPRLNMTRTGELYVPRDVPMLRGFL